MGGTQHHLRNCPAKMWRNDRIGPDSVARTFQMSVSCKTEEGQGTVLEQKEKRRWASRRSAWPMIRFWVSPSNPKTNSYEEHFYSRCGILDIDCLLGNNEGSNKPVLFFFGVIVVLWLCSIIWFYSWVDTHSNFLEMKYSWCLWFSNRSAKAQNVKTESTPI